MSKEYEKKLSPDFHMRKLNKDDLEQFNDLLKYAFQVTTKEMRQTGWSNESIKHDKSPMLSKGYVLGWFHKEKLASQILIYPMEVNVEGKIMKMGGITGVTTYPEYSGLGLIHRLMIECLKHMRQEKQYISFLYPYSIPFYRKKGWEIVSDQLIFSIKDSQLPKRQPVSGMVERVDRDNKDLYLLHDAFATQNHGAIIRNELEWREYWRWDSDDITVAIYYNEEHKPLGYVVYYIENDIFHIKEMIYLNLEGRYGLWNYIGAHYSMVEEVRGYNYTGEPLAYLLEDSEIKESIQPYIMARIVDVLEFILQYNWQTTPENLTMYLYVTDSLADWNNGYYKIWWEEDKNCCEMVEEGDAINVISLDIQTLTAMLMGYKRPTYLYNNSKLDMEYYWVKILEQLINNDKPYFSDYF